MRKDAKRARREIRSFTDLSDFKDIHQGQKCFVCGAGPSIGFLDIRFIHEHVVIAVNSSALLMPWGKGELAGRFWVSNDSLCQRWDYFWSHVLRSKCSKLVRTSWRQYDDKIARHGFRYFAPRHSESHPLDSSDAGLCSVSSVPTAIDFAILLGCKEVYLLGVDHKMVHGNSHFWQFWDKSKWPQRSDKRTNFVPPKEQQKQIFKKNLSVFLALKKYADKYGTEVYNCSTRSHFEMFENVSLEDALNATR